MIEIRRNDTETFCAVCGRTLLLGERVVGYQHAEGDDARVCELCIDQADARGWIREGSLSVPLQLHSPRSRQRGLRGFLGGSRRPPRAPEPFTPEALPDDPREAVAWDLSWYQFRVDMLGSQPVTLQHRGEDVGEIDSRFRDWNAQAEPDGTLALAV